MQYRADNATELSVDHSVKHNEEHGPEHGAESSLDRIARIVQRLLMTHRYYSELSHLVFIIEHTIAIGSLPVACWQSSSTESCCHAVLIELITHHTYLLNNQT